MTEPIINPHADPTPVPSTTSSTESAPLLPATLRRGTNPALVIFLIIPLVGLFVAGYIALSSRPSATPAITPAPVSFAPTTLINNPAPQFNVASPQGNNIRLTDMAGKWVFLNFWATWCEPCVVEMPLLQQLYEGKFGSDPARVTVLAINKAETRAEVTSFLDKYKLTLPVGLDTDSTVNGQYLIVNLPITYIIDPSGIARYQHIGVLDEAAIAAYLKLIAEAKTP
jgi:peroxiredoxin